MSYDRNSLIRLYDRIAALKNGIGWVSKRKLGYALRDVMRKMENVEKI